MSKMTVEARRSFAGAIGSSPAPLVVMLVAAATSLTCLSLGRHLPPADWWSAAMGADGSAVSAWVVHYSFLPRLVVSILAGAMLALAAAIFQQVLRNPLAEPATLGVSAGASLAVTASTLWLPGMLGFGREGAAILGGAIATALVFGLSWKRGLSPLSLILAGLIVSLFLGSVSAVISLFHNQILQSVFLWSSGTLRQNDWGEVKYLLPRLVAGLVLACLIVRPLTILSLDDESGRSLGLSQRNIRLLALAVAVSLSAFVVSAVGMIGFVGLAAPAIARLAGARTAGQRLTWAPMVGGSLLWLTDQLVQILPLLQELPTGVGTAILGAPILIWMLPRLKANMVPPRSDTADLAFRTRRSWTVVLVALMLLIILILPVLFLGQVPHGWTWLSTGDAERLLRWRWPRTTAALGGGAVLAMAGTILQRMTANPMASPEVLGVSSGAACGVILLAFLAPTPDKSIQMGAAAIGASITLFLILAIGRKTSFSPERMLLVGVALATVFGALVSMLMVSGDPRMGMLLSWMAGSTYQVTNSDAVIVIIVVVASLPAMMLFSRWLEILPLGEASARALGIGLASSRLWLLTATAVLTGTATLIVGPLSFVGLMAPHMARMMGLQRPMPQLYGSAVLGAFIMLMADWLGRNLLFPYQVPAGLLATFVGGPYFMWIFRRGGA
ncbi:ABC-type transporter, integral membrane subunit [Rhizobium sp. CF080]|uniref:Fe(3+)-hydroxamate ABC transporter permease FhuB n=1 Tax=Rhizobium sp. (strain CF080) TaxID=1144310 RepID=UPI0002717062|nr:Fe(3+)-hydroxamate ABC transporter permease FhuB [Rhizobium sp. CF080]EUB98239.1 ABC-type transporter, integral membrane subunit [Rhizobium sp. CF080]